MQESCWKCLALRWATSYSLMTNHSSKPNLSLSLCLSCGYSWMVIAYYGCNIICMDRKCKRVVGCALHLDEVLFMASRPIIHPNHLSLTHFEHSRSIEILVFQSPSNYMLWSFGFFFISRCIYFHKFLYKGRVISVKPWTSSTGSYLPATQPNRFIRN